MGRRNWRRRFGGTVREVSGFAFSYSVAMIPWGGGSVYNQCPSFRLDLPMALLWEDRPSTVRSGNTGPRLPRKSQPVTAAPGKWGRGQNQHWSLLVPLPDSHNCQLVRKKRACDLRDKRWPWVLVGMISFVGGALTSPTKTRDERRRKWIRKD